MKKLRIVASLLLGCCIGTTWAQSDITVHDERTGKDEVIEMPEGMTCPLDSLLAEWNAKKYLERDSDCRMQDVNPYFEADVYKQRLRRMPAVMEMPYNSIVQKFIDQYTSRLRNSVSYMLGAANFYIPLFEEALDLYQLPLELKYLPVIESALDPCATSRAGAVGLWQFMLSTGKTYGLEVNSLVDERRDPVKSTLAAAQYLRDLYKIFGDWTLVIAAYNCGPSVINKAIHRAGGVQDYWAIYPYLPKETRGYVPAFIAANYIMNYYCEHNICPMKTRMPVLTDTVMVNRNVHFEQIAALCNIDVEAVKNLNPQYKNSVVPGEVKTSSLRLPTAALTAFIDAGDSVYNYRAGDLFTKRVEVQVQEVAATRTTTKNTRSRSTSSRAQTVTVRSGQTLSALAKKYGTTVTQLKRLNGLKDSNIRAGKKIRVR